MHALAREEADWIRRSIAGDHAAFAKIVSRYRSTVAALAYRLCGDPATAEDIAQDAFVHAWQALPRFRGEASLRTWLYRIASNTALQRLRSARPTVSLDGTGLPGRDALPQASIASNAEFWQRLAPRLHPRPAARPDAQQRLAFLPSLGLAISSAALQGLALLVSIAFLLQRWNRLPAPAALDVTPLARPLVGPLAWDLGARLVDNLHVSSALTWPVVGEWAILAAWTSALGILVLLSGLHLGWLVHWVRNSNRINSGQAASDDA